MPINTRPKATRPPQRTGYYGKDIGRPVKVKPQMRENAPRTRTQRGDNTTRETESRGRRR